MTGIAMRIGLRRVLHRVIRAAPAAVAVALIPALLPALLADADRLGQVLALAAGLTVCYALAGEHLAHRLLDRNRPFLDLTPLPASLLLRHNLSGMILTGLVLAIAGPVVLACTLLHAGPAYSGSGWSSAPIKWILLLHVELTCLAMLVLPLYLRLTGRRWVGKVFVPWCRGPVLGLLLLPCILVLILAVHVPPIVAQWRHLAEYLAAVGRSGAVGDTLVFLVVPFYSVLATHGASGPQAAAVITLALALAVGVLGAGVARALRVDIVAIERRGYEDWLAWRTEHEEEHTGCDAAAVNASPCLRSDGASRSCSSAAKIAGVTPQAEPQQADSPHATSLEGLEAGLPAYDVALAPEAQAIRHREHWRAEACPPRPIRQRLLRHFLSRPWLMAGLVGWVLFLHSGIVAHASQSQEQSIRAALAFFFVAMPLLGILARCVDSDRVYPSYWVAVPGRWHVFLWHRLRRQVRRALPGDIVAGALLCALMRWYNPLVLCALLATFSLMRAISETAVFLEVRSLSGRRLAYALCFMSLIFFLGIALSVGLAMTIIENEPLPGRLRWGVEAMAAFVALEAAWCAALLAWEYLWVGGQMIVPIRPRVMRPS